MAEDSVSQSSETVQDHTSEALFNESNTEEIKKQENNQLLNDEPSESSQAVQGVAPTVQHNAVASALVNELNREENKKKNNQVVDTSVPVFSISPSVKRTPSNAKDATPEQETPQSSEKKLESSQDNEGYKCSEIILSKNENIKIRYLSDERISPQNRLKLQERVTHIEGLLLKFSKSEQKAVLEKAVNAFNKSSFRKGRGFQAVQFSKEGDWILTFRDKNPVGAIDEFIKNLKSTLKDENNQENKESNAHEPPKSATPKWTKRLLDFMRPGKSTAANNTEVMEARISDQPRPSEVANDSEDQMNGLSTSYQNGSK